VHHVAHEVNGAAGAWSVHEVSAKMQVLNNRNTVILLGVARCAHDARGHSAGDGFSDDGAAGTPCEYLNLKRIRGKVSGRNFDEKEVECTCPGVSIKT
jgi:hypothetical protein